MLEKLSFPTQNKNKRIDICKHSKILKIADKGPRVVGQRNGQYAVL